MEPANYLNPTRSAPINPALFRESNQEIIHQESDTSRISYVEKQYHQKSQLSIFERSCTQNTPFHPTIDPIDPPFDFTKENKTVRVTISDLLNSSPKLNSVLDNQLNVILKIKNITELNQLQTLLTNQSNIFNIKNFDKITELDFEALVVNINTNGPINALLTIISQHHMLPRLTKLSIGNIKPHCTLTIPDSLNNLQSLIISEISNNATLILPDSFSSITTLTIKYMRWRTTLILPDSFKSLTTLTTGGMDAPQPPLSYPMHLIA